MKKIAVLIIALSFLSACKGQPNPKVWTKKYEQGFYNYLDSTCKPTMPDLAKRSKYVAFIISRLKEEIPNGLNSVSKDSLHNLNIRIGREYAMKERNEGNYDPGVVPHYEIWTPMIEKTFRDDFYAIAKNKKPAMNDKFCDCFIKNLKTIYPDSILTPLPKEISQKVGFICAKYLDAH